MSKNKTSTTKSVKSTVKNNITAKKDSTGQKTCYIQKTLQFIGLILIIIGVGFFSNKYLFKSSSENETIAIWVQENPEAILESIVNMQKKQAQNQQQNAQKNISARFEDLYNRKDSPTKEASGSDVTIIEFFDYNCGYCKKALESIKKIAATDKKVKIIFKELPILGQSSEDLAKIALAFNIIAPSKYFDFHSALMKSKARTSGEAIKIAEVQGVTKAKINRILKKFDTKINEEITLNRELSASIGIRGTPAFLIGDQLFPGAVGFEALQQAIKQARQNK